MKKILLAVAMAVLSTSVLALDTNGGTIDVSSTASAFTGTFAQSWGGGSVTQTASVLSTNTSYGNIAPYDTSVAGTSGSSAYNVDTYGLTGSATTTGSVTTSTSGSVTGTGTGWSVAYGNQTGDVIVNANRTIDDGNIVLNVSPEAHVNGQAWSTTVGTGSDNDSSFARATETSNAYVRVTTTTTPVVSVPGQWEWGHYIGGPNSTVWHSLPLPSSGQAPQGDGEWRFVSTGTEVIPSTTTASSTVVGASSVATSTVSGTGDGNFQTATTYGIVGNSLVNNIDASASYEDIIHTTIGPVED